MICLMCRGYGMVKVKKRVLWCPNCEGMGRERERALFFPGMPSNSGRGRFPYHIQVKGQQARHV